MKIKLIILLLLTFLLSSCHDKYGTDFKVTNNSENKVDSAIVTNGFHFVKLKNLKLNESRIDFIDFDINPPKNDGNYGIIVYSNRAERKQLFGYYSNGIPDDTGFDIFIEKDTIIIKEYMKD